MTEISFTWLSRRSGNDAFVVEESSTGIRMEFGPMPPRLVIPFIEARRRLAALRAAAIKASYVEPEDMEYLQ